MKIFIFNYLGSFVCCCCTETTKFSADDIFNFLGEGTHYVGMKSAEQEVTRYLRRQIATPFINIMNSSKAIEMCKPIKEEVMQR